MVQRKEGWYTLAEIAGRVGVSSRTVLDDVKRGRLKAELPPGRVRGWLVPEAEALRYEREEWGGRADA